MGMAVTAPRPWPRNPSGSSVVLVAFPVPFFLLSHMRLVLLDHVSSAFVGVCPGRRRQRRRRRGVSCPLGLGGFW